MAKKLKHKTILTAESEGLVDLLAYCLMDNHIHLLLRENTSKGTSRYLQRLLNAYAKYFNMRESRSGSLFLHPFKAVLVDGDDQLLHVARYIHLNPYVAHMIADPFSYHWSSLNEYLLTKQEPKCHTSLLNTLLNIREHKKFIADEAGYAMALSDVQHLLLDNED